MTRTVLAALLAGALMLTSNSASALDDTLDEGLQEELRSIRDGLSASDEEERREALRMFTAGGPQRFRAAALEVTVRGLRDDDPEVKWRSLQALQVLLYMPPPELPALSENEAVRTLVAEALGSDDDEVIVSAAHAYILIFGESAETEELVFSRIDSIADQSKQEELMRYVAHNGFASDAVRDELLDIGREEASIRSVGAATTLLAAYRPDPPPRELLAELVRLAEWDEFFANPHLLGGVGRYGAAAIEFLPRLREMRTRLTAELERPQDRRSIVVYGEESTLDSLSLVIKQLEQLDR